MKIMEIIKDIFDDAEQHRTNYKDFADDQYVGRWYRRRKDASAYSMFRVALPNIAGFLVGLAFTRLMEFTGIWYFIFGIIGALGIGVLESTLFDGISLKYAILRHFIIVFGLSLVFGIIYMINIV